MSVTKKAQVIARELASRLTTRLGMEQSTLTVVSGVDASNNPTILISDGTAATGEQTIFMRVTTSPAPLGLNSVGGTQESYGPHVIQMVCEQLAGDTGTLAVLGANLLRTAGEVFRCGTKVELYLTANTTVPSVSGITGTPALTFDDLYHPLTGTV